MNTPQNQEYQHASLSGPERRRQAVRYAGMNNGHLALYGLHGELVTREIISAPVKAPAATPVTVEVKPVRISVPSSALNNQMADAGREAAAQAFDGAEVIDLSAYYGPQAPAAEQQPKVA